MKQAIRLFAVCAVFLLLSSGSAWSRTYKIAVVPWAGFSPIQVAETKGFFESRGVDVRVVSFPSSQAMRSALDQKLVDIGFNMIGTVIGWHNEGDPLVVIAETGWSHGGDKIIVKKNAAVDAMRKKPVGVYMNQAPILYFLNLYLKDIGIELSDVRIVEMETETLADKFIDGLFQIIVSYDPQALRAEREGNGTVVATSATFDGSIPEGMMARQDVLSAIPEPDLVKIFEGWIEAAEWCRNPANWPEYMAILNKITFRSDPAYSEDDLKGMRSAVRIHDRETLLQRNRNDGELTRYLVLLKEFLKENDMLNRDYAPETIFQNDAIMRALRN